MSETIKVLIKKKYRIGGRVETKTIGVVQTDVPVSQISRGHNTWKRMVQEKVLESNVGEKIVSANVLSSPVDGAHIVITLEAVRKGFVPGKPVTRGGVPIGEPKIGKTMASARRQGR